MITYNVSNQYLLGPIQKKGITFFNADKNSNCVQSLQLGHFLISTSSSHDINGLKKLFIINL